MGAIRPRSARSAARGDRWPQRPRNRTRLVLSGTFSFGPKQTRAPQQTSGRAFPVVSFVYLPVECPFYKFYRINCRPKLGAKLLDRFFHRRRQVSPVVNCLTHRFFDGDYHLFDGDVAVSFHDSLASHFGAAVHGGGWHRGWPADKYTRREDFRRLSRKLSSRMGSSVPSRWHPTTN